MLGYQGPLGTGQIEKLYYRFQPIPGISALKRHNPVVLPGGVWGGQGWGNLNWPSGLSLRLGGRTSETRGHALSPGDLAAQANSATEV